MKAAVLEDVERIRVTSVPDPQVHDREVLLRVRAVGVCGTDLHIYQGKANWNFDARGRQVPLAEQPQILGHEYSAEVVETGKNVTDLQVGARVACDQGINCASVGRTPLCEYCASGYSHHCRWFQERGISGQQGALAEYIVMPALNCLRLQQGMSDEQGALVEPLACILHASYAAESARARYTLAGKDRIRNVLICGAGPAGLLFLQYLRRVRHFNGLILVSDLRERNLALAEQFGGTAVNPKSEDLPVAVEEHTHGERIHYLIDACGDPALFRMMPSILRNQATVLIYGAGRNGGDMGWFDLILRFEPTIIAPAGASGGFDPDGRPTVYREALQLIAAGKVQVSPFVTHRYGELEQIHLAFEEDFRKPDYIKGVLTLS
jgi:L-iditol 2-dehydrogenase